MGRSGQVSKRQGLSRHVTWALLSTDRGGQSGMGVREGRGETKTGIQELQGSPDRDARGSQRERGHEVCGLGKSCGHLYQGDARILSLP